MWRNGYCDSDCRLGIELSMGTMILKPASSRCDSMMVDRSVARKRMRTSPRCENSSVGDELDITVVCDPLGDAAWLRIVRGKTCFAPVGKPAFARFHVNQICSPVDNSHRHRFMSESLTRW